MLFVSLPLSYLFGFKLELMLVGVVLGYGAQAALLFGLYSLILIRVDWVKTALLASKTNESAHESSSVEMRS